MTNDSKSISISIEDIIEYWHTHEAGKSLREFLGMSENEYADWLKGDTSFQIDRKKWEPCHSCDSKCLTCMINETDKCRRCKDYKYYLPLYQFCPKCGRPLTDEAWDELEKRLRGVIA